MTRMITDKIQCKSVESVRNKRRIELQNVQECDATKMIRIGVAGNIIGI